MSEHREGYLPALFSQLSNMEHKLALAYEEIVLLRRDKLFAWTEVMRLRDELKKYQTEEQE